MSEEKKQTKGIYAFLDIVADDLGPIFEAQNHLVAARMRRNACEKYKTAIGDIAIMHLGEIDSKGNIQSVIPRMLSSVETGEFIETGIKTRSEEK